MDYPKLWKIFTRGFIFKMSLTKNVLLFEFSVEKIVFRKIKLILASKIDPDN